MAIFRNVVFLCLILCTATNGEHVAKSNGTRGQDVDGPALIKLGRQLKKPLLTVIGMAINNLHQCDEWTQWSVCDTSVMEFFGIRKRTRKCGKRNGSDGPTGHETRIESDMNICEGYCPTHYNLTKNGFCMKLYVVAKNHEDAEAQCKTDGGHLINIDSDLKYGDVKSILSGFSPNVNIGGERKDVNSPWVYEYGIQTGFFKWFSGYPKSTATYLCLSLSNKLFFNYPCTTEYAFICEVPA